MSLAIKKWNDQFVGSTNQKCVCVNVNGEFDQGKVLYMEPDWTLRDFLNAASKRLEVFPAAERLFNADGVEITDCMMIVDDDLLFVSNGADFLAPVSEEVVGADGFEVEKLPSVLAGYRVGKFLGKGAFGEVRLGEHQLTNEKVALKFLRKSEILSIGAAERTTIEIQCLSTLRHTSIIRLHQHLETPQHVVLVFEVMEGGDLYSYLCQQGNTPAQMSIAEDEARPLFHQILSAIGYAHNQHICHRDLKLENILLKSCNSLSVVKVADFGLSDFYRPGVMRKSSCGTLSFLAPEAFKGTSNAGPPLDVWSLGVILFAVLCGRLPFEGQDSLAKITKPREVIIRSRILKCQYKIDDRLGPEAKDLVRRMLKLDPAERASIPEIFNHCWLRPISSTLIDFSSASLSTPGVPSTVSPTSATNMQQSSTWHNGGGTPPLVPGPSVTMPPLTIVTAPVHIHSTANIATKSPTALEVSTASLSRSTSVGLVDSLDILRGQSHVEEADGMTDKSSLDNISRLASEDETTVTVGGPFFSSSSCNSPAPCTASLTMTSSDVDDAASVSLIEGVSPAFSRLMPLRRRINTQESLESFEEQFDNGLKNPSISSFEPALHPVLNRPLSMQSNDRVGRGNDRGSNSPPELNGTGTKRSSSSLGSNPSRTHPVSQSTTTLGSSSSSKENNMVLVSSSMSMAARSSLLLSTPITGIGAAPITSVLRKSRPSYVNSGSVKDKPVT